jgi:dihydroneopterin aldolase
MGAIYTKLFLEDYEINVEIGIHEFEKIAPQRILISMEIFMLGQTLNSDDNIDDVLDYDFIRTEIAKLVKYRSFNLQETLCRAILDIVRKRSGIRKIIVRTKKPDVYSDCRSVGVELTYETS